MVLIMGNNSKSYKTNDGKIAGIIYPLNEQNLNRLIKQQNPMYVKYTTSPGAIKNIKLRKGHLLLLYLSKKNKSIVGYSKIKEVLFMKASEIKMNHIDRIQMDKKDFKDYIKGREEKLLICLELEKILKLKEEKQYPSSMSMAGKYVIEEEVNHLINK